MRGPGTNALWLGLMTLGRIVFNLLAMVFVMILRVTLQREMGLKSLGLVRVRLLRDKAYMSVIIRSSILIIVKDLESSFSYILANNVPVGVIEQGR
ncbi:hypothetical protein QL285_019734 [Trifolium repens]|nr:hypothetical protein QL285_019734 [Trifolium repens]